MLKQVTIHATHLTGRFITAARETELHTWWTLHVASEVRSQDWRQHWAGYVCPCGTSITAKGWKGDSITSRTMREGWKQGIRMAELVVACWQRGKRLFRILTTLLQHNGLRLDVISEIQMQIQYRRIRSAMLHALLTWKYEYGCFF